TCAHFRGSRCSKVAGRVDGQWLATWPPTFPGCGRVGRYPSSVEPGLWGNMLENRNFQAVVHVRDGSGHEDLHYTFSTATLLSFQTTESDGAAPVDHITLSFDHVAEDYKVLNPDGSVASNNHALFDVSQSTVGAGGNLSAPALAAPPMVGITFDTG